MNLQFDENKFRENLKKVLGFETVPDDELYKHDIILNSPTGQHDGLKVSVGDYIDNEARITRESYNSLEKQLETFDDNIFNINLAKPIEQLSFTQSSTSFNPDNVKYYDIEINGKSYTVSISYDPDDFTSMELFNVQSAEILNSPYFIKERSRDFLIGMENHITYYQYKSLLQMNDRSLYVDFKPFGEFNDNIANQLNMIFEGDTDLDDIRKQFSL